MLSKSHIFGIAYPKLFPSSKGSSPDESSDSILGGELACHSIQMKVNMTVPKVGGTIHTYVISVIERWCGISYGESSSNANFNLTHTLGMFQIEVIILDQRLIFLIPS